MAGRKFQEVNSGILYGLLATADNRDQSWLQKAYSWEDKAWLYRTRKLLAGHGSKSILPGLHIHEGTGDGGYPVLQHKIS